MIDQRGIVTQVESGLAQVKVGGQSGCSACDAGRGCGAGLFGRLLQRSDVLVTVPALPQTRKGDPVTLGISDQSYLWLVVLLYGLPLLFGLAGGALAFWLGDSLMELSLPWLDLATAAGAVAMGGMAIFLVRRLVPSSFHHLQLVLIDIDAPLDCGLSNRH